MKELRKVNGINWIFGWACLLCLSPVSIFAQVTSDFIANTSSGCSPLLVNFTDLSSGPVTSWQWDFGNGATSTQPNPGILYNAPGTYTVSLTVSGGGATDAETKFNYITVNGSPTAAISATPLQGCAPLVVQFSDQSQTSGSPLSSWIWDFGDGTTSTLANPQHTYLSAGGYTVNMYVTDVNGCTANFTQPNYIQVGALPQAAFAIDTPQACVAPHTVNFINNTQGTGPFTYQWDFGDGNSSVLQNPGHTYLVAGTYPVSLIVTGTSGCADTIMQAAAVQIAGPSANFTVNKIRLCQGENAIFFDQSTGNPSGWVWNFGDGSQDSSQNPVHAYANVGTYNVQLTVTTANGCQDSIVQNSLIQVIGNPIADFTANNLQSCQVPFIVNFTDQSTNAVSWAWDFGDGATSTLASPSHTYTTAGLFDVRLAVMNADSCVDTLLRIDYVEIVPPTAYFTSGSAQSGCIPLIYTFTDSSYTSIGSINSWSWDFGDATTSSLQNPTHSYGTAGFYDITLIVTTTGGCRDTLFLSNFISTGTPPTADYSATPLVTCFGDTIQFTNLSTNSTAWTWDFGDTFQSGSQNPIHVYPLPGCYDVTLVADNAGCSDSIVRNNYICIEGARAGFSYNPAFSCTAPVNASFTSTPTGSSLKWSWSFGDGGGANGANVTHTYAMPGVYPVTMYVADTTAMCNDSITQNFVIGASKSDFTQDTTFGCIPLLVSFIDMSIQATSWQWDFGDGSSDTVANPSHTYTTQGTYDVQLITFNQFGCSDTLLFLSRITALGITADFSVVSQQVCAGNSLTLADSSASFTFATAWQWDFGDGGSASTANPTHTYATAGNYSVSLIVTDSTGCMDSIARPNYISVFEPIAAFTTDFTSLCPGESLQTTNLSTGGGLTHQWTFGDGNTSSATAPAHSYAASGSYPLQLTVTDTAGCQDSAVQTILVALPAASFAISDSVANCPPLLVAFTDQSVGDIQTYQWGFGDGTGGTSANPNHLYTTAGIFSAQLIVTTSSGCQDTFVYPTVIDVGRTVGSIALSTDTICPGAPLTLSLNGGGNAVINWIFGDGNVIAGGPIVQHAYANSGSYLASVILQDSLGCTLVISASDSLYVQPGPTAAFSAAPRLLCGPDTVQFTDLSSFASPLVAWSWDLGNGNVAAQPNPVGHYQTPGMYPVQLAVSDSLGCTDTLVLPNFVRMLDLQAGFATDTSAGCVPLGINFSDATQADTTLIGWLWDFGNGNMALGANVNQVFPDSGLFTVRLIVTDAAGCQDTIFVPGAVSAYAPENVLAPEIVVATVVNNVGIEVNWAPLGFRGAGDVVLERGTNGNDWMNIARIAAGNTNYLDNAVAVDMQSYRYRIVQEDSCGGVSPLSQEAHSILLEVDDTDGLGRISWNAYTDWPAGVMQYELEGRDADGGNWQVLATLPGSQLSYVDPGIQEGAGGRCYRVRAFEAKSNGAVSLSNEDCGRGEIWVPNTLTPNNDGANDLLVIPAISGFPGTELTIYNRWGGQVYASADYQNDWGGRHQASGNVLPDGTYFYVLTLGRSGLQLKGSITLMR